MLGDSYAEACQVPLETLSGRLCNMVLESCEALGGKGIGVINLGVSGHGTAQELEPLRHRGWNFDPDIVLLAFFTGNDIHDNSRALADKPGGPYFTYQGDDTLVVVASYLNPSCPHHQSSIANRRARYLPIACDSSPMITGMASLCSSFVHYQKPISNRTLIENGI